MFLGLVLPGRVDGVFGEDLSGACVADGDVAVVDEHEDGYAGVCGADAEVAEFAGVSECDFPELVDLVGS